MQHKIKIVGAKIEIQFEINFEIFFQFLTRSSIKFARNTETSNKQKKNWKAPCIWKYMKNFPNSFSSFVWLYLKLFLMVRKSEHVPYSPKFYLISLNSRIFLRAENFKGNLKLFDYSQWENPLNSPKILYRI